MSLRHSQLRMKKLGVLLRFAASGSIDALCEVAARRQLFDVAIASAQPCQRRTFIPPTLIRSTFPIY